MIDDLVKNSEIPELRRGSDTIKAWEAYRDEAQLWRALALLQIPVTFVSLLLSLLIWMYSQPIINIPPSPAPGEYSVGAIDDVVFVDYAQEFVNLFASYTPVNARKQFLEARKFLTEPVLTKFNDEIIVQELGVIETTSRTQFFFVDPAAIVIKRRRSEIAVTFGGERIKILAGSQLPSVRSEYELRMVTVPRNRLNPFGIAIKSINLKDVEQ